jgi:hypothetical protein
LCLGSCFHLTRLPHSSGSSWFPIAPHSAHTKTHPRLWQSWACSHCPCLGSGFWLSGCPCSAFYLFPICCSLDSHQVTWRLMGALYQNFLPGTLVCKFKTSLFSGCFASESWRSWRAPLAS